MKLTTFRPDLFGPHREFQAFPPMLHVIGLPFNPFQENTWLLHNGDEAIVIDPGCWNREEEHVLEEELTRNKLRLVRCLLTHAHIDHVLGLAWVHRRFGLAPELHRADLPLLDAAPRQGQMYGIPCEASPPAKAFLKEGDIITLGGDELSVVHVPGHSPGHVAFVCGAQAFVVSGDVLFKGSIGRTDLPGGDHDQLIDSIRSKLLPMADNTVVYCGHGPDTTIGEERRSNPFLR